MSITKTQFRLLLGYIIVVALSVLSDIWTASVVPDIVKELEPSIPQVESMLLWILQGAFIISPLILGLLGFIGMFCFWSASRYIYFIAIALKILQILTMEAWMVYTNWDSFFVEIELFLDGVILTLCLLGPARHLFENKEVTNQVVETTP